MCAARCAVDFSDSRFVRGSSSSSDGSLANFGWYRTHADDAASCISALIAGSVTTMKRQSCAFWPDGARIAASMSWNSSSSGTGSVFRRRNARVEYTMRKNAAASSSGIRRPLLRASSPVLADAYCGGGWHSGPVSFGLQGVGVGKIGVPRGVRVAVGSSVGVAVRPRRGVGVSVAAGTGVSVGNGGGVSVGVGVTVAGPGVFVGGAGVADGIDTPAVTVPCGVAVRVPVAVRGGAAPSPPPPPNPPAISAPPANAKISRPSAAPANSRMRLRFQPSPPL